MDKLIEKALESKNFDEKLDEAAEVNIKVQEELKPEQKDLMDAYVRKMIDINPEMHRIYSAPKKRRRKEEQYKLKEFIASQKKQFKAVKRVVCPTIKPDGSVVNPLEKMVEKIAKIYQMLIYIGNEEILKIFNDANLSFKVNKLEEECPEFADESVKQYVAYIFKTVTDNNNRIQSLKNSIKNEIYPELDPEIRYSEENKNGLKASQFESLAAQKAVSMTKTDAEYQNFKDKKLDIYESSISSLNIALEKSKEI